MPTKSQHAFNMWVQLLQARDAVYNARYKELSDYGITQREAAVLHAVISLDREATPSGISRWAYRKPHTISQILERMHKKGLIEKNKDLPSRNLVRISLTEKGKIAYENSLRRKSIGRTFRVLSTEEQLVFSSCLTKIRDSALTEIGDSIHRPFP